jgi:hypothetical protein
MHLPAHDLAAVQVEDQVQVEPSSHHLCRQVGHVPAPDLARRRGDVRGRRPDRLGRLGASAVSGLSVRLQHPAEGGFAGQVDPSSASMGTMRAGGTAAKRGVGHGQQLCPLGLRQGMGRYRAHGLWPAITALRPSPAASVAECADRCRPSRRPASAARRRHVRTWMSRASAWRSSRPIIRPLPC